MPQPAPEAAPDDSHRVAVTLAVMAATIMQALDMTIANVALPRMQGTMGATQEQMSWVLTSYIVATAISIPLTGFLSARLGRKRLFMWAVALFTLTSMLCGAAQSLEQVVAARVLQGMSGACLVPLSQAVLLDAYPRERHGQAMAMWGMGVMIGPIMGPTLGGWLTEHYSWRWVFYINLPVGLLAWFGLAAFLRPSAPDSGRRLDLTGFMLLAVGLGALQLMLDRGELLNWFHSPQIVVQAMVAAGALYLFVAHLMTAERPFFEPGLFVDRNFVVGLMLIFATGMILLATLALLPPLMHNLLGYDALDVGWLLAPRGVGTMVSMFIVGRLSGRVDPRVLILCGLCIVAWSLHDMAGFSLDITQHDILRTGLTQGVGLGLVFVPSAALSFSSLPARLRDDGTALYSLMRNLGSSIGISVLVTWLARNTQANHAAFASYIHPFSLPLRQAADAGALDLSSPAGLLLLQAELNRQAAMLAFVQDFRMVMWVALACMPLLLLLRPPGRVGPVAVEAG